MGEGVREGDTQVDGGVVDEAGEEVGVAEPAHEGGVGDDGARQR